jgi:hypothetical protein
LRYAYFVGPEGCEIDVLNGPIKKQFHSNYEFMLKAAWSALSIYDYNKAIPAASCGEYTRRDSIAKPGIKYMNNHAYVCHHSVIHGTWS